MNFCKLYDLKSGKYVSKKWALEYLKLSEQSFEELKADARPSKLYSVEDEDGGERALLTGRYRALGAEQLICLLIGCIVGLLIRTFAV